MDAEVKKLADNKDSKSLRYIFVDCLDVDPTFEEYREDYEYCKKIPEIFETYVELTPLEFDKSRWDEQYWVNIKLDFVKNFSIKRFEHMMDVAKVVRAEKISRLIREKKMQQQTLEEKSKRTSFKTVSLQNGTEQAKISSKRKQEIDIENAKRKLDEENRRTEEERARNKERERKRIEQMKSESSQKQTKDSVEDNGKKWMGVGLVLIIVVLVIIILLKRM